MLSNPSSVRLSITVLEAIDRLAKEEDRNRASMLRRLLATHPRVMEAVAWAREQKAAQGKREK